MSGRLTAIPIERPVATTMVFLAVVVLGLYSWLRIPIELLPAIKGETFFIHFSRPAADPQTLEREILLPLESRIKELPDIQQTWAEIGVRSNRKHLSGMLTVEFEPSSNSRVRELELQRIAAAMQKEQPMGSNIFVTSRDSSAISRFVMSIQFIGEDTELLREIVEQSVENQLGGVPGVAQVLVRGVARKELAITIDQQRLARYGITSGQVRAALNRSVQGLEHVGTATEHNHNISVLVDGRPQDTMSLGQIRIVRNKTVLLSDIADIEVAPQPQRSIYRVNGQSSLGLLVFQDEGENLVQLGQNLRQRLELLRSELEPYNIQFVIDFDGSQTIDEQLDLLKKLALSGFLIALLVLFFFVRSLRAVMVIAIAVPVSICAAAALLFLNGYTLNLYTLLGLVIGIGMLVDNSIVVYEAVQRRLEKGEDASNAALVGIGRTIRAIITASATNAIVFLPLLYLDAVPVMMRGLLENIVPAILFPLVSSLLVAIFLVPMLTQRLLMADAKVKSATVKSQNAFEQQPLPALFSGVLKVALRRPAVWVSSIAISLFLTIVVALPWVLVQTAGQGKQDNERVKFELVFTGSTTLETADGAFVQLERKAMALDGVTRVVSNFQADQGSIMLYLEADEPEHLKRFADGARKTIKQLVNDIDNVNIDGQIGRNRQRAAAANEIAVSGPDMMVLRRLADQIRANLKSIPAIDEVYVTRSNSGMELALDIQQQALLAHQLEPEQVLDALPLFSTQGQRLTMGYSLADGRELPMVIRHSGFNQFHLIPAIEKTLIATTSGVMPLGEFVTGDRVKAPVNLFHHNGRRELTISYHFDADAPATGPERVALEQQIENEIRNVYRPSGYTVEQPFVDENINWFEVALIPIVFLLFAVLAIAFESLALPLLVMLAIPLTVLGAVWGLVVAGIGLDFMALVGVVVLIGLTVNPAILLLDRMQQKVTTQGSSFGGAALAAVKERTRPILMTSCTTIVGLWPLAIVSGLEAQSWPPFATVVMGGLITSTLLTLLVIPVGFVMMKRLESVLYGLSQKIWLYWLIMTTAIMSALIFTGLVQSVGWQLFLAVTIAIGVLWLQLLIRKNPLEQAVEVSNMVVETRYLSKVYGRAGSVAKAWQKICNSVVDAQSMSTAQIRHRLPMVALLGCGFGYLAVTLESLFWRIGYSYLTGFCICGILLLTLALGSKKQAQDNQQSDDKTERLNRLMIAIAPWAVLLVIVWQYTIAPSLQDKVQPLLPGFAIMLALITVMVQTGRSNAVLIAEGKRTVKVKSGKFQSLRSSWRYISLKLFGWDLVKPEFTALSSVSFRAETGMIGILGPNGAGKTTFFRLLASVLEPTIGTIYYAGQRNAINSSALARLIGYLPQEFGLPRHLTGREYLDYFALLYEVGNEAERKQRVDFLLGEVGLTGDQHKVISGLSGGMRQRLVIARTLLLEPPVILVDEPTSGLDPRERIRLRNMLSKLARDRVVLFSTHIVEDVAISCDNILVLKRGQIVYEGKTDALAQKAHGKMWQLLLDFDQVEQFQQQYVVVTQVPLADNKVNLRVLCDNQPHPDAVSVDSVLEDGYFKLFHDLGGK